MSIRLSLGALPAILGRTVIPPTVPFAGPSRVVFQPHAPIRPVQFQHRAIASSRPCLTSQRRSSDPPLQRVTSPAGPLSRSRKDQSLRWQPPASAPSSSSSLFGQIFRRAFHNRPPLNIRQTYFPKGQGRGGSSGPSGPGGWFRSLRRRIDRVYPLTLVYALIAANVIIFLLWQYAIQSYQRFGDPSLYRFLSNNFVLNEANIMAGRVWTLLTACFSHSGGNHIFMNCLSLYFLAPAVASLLGSSAFLGLYFGGGILASLISLTWHRTVAEPWVGSEGASGAIYACLAFYGAVFPRTTFLLFFVVPVPAWVLIPGLFAWDAYSAIFTKGSGIDSAGHVGGIIAGLAAAVLMRGRGSGGFRGFRGF